MLVNPELVRAFAGQVDHATAAMSGVNADGTASGAAGGLPGSETQWATYELFALVAPS
jgi:Zn-dependent M28 family amino/carboxypeptidase